MAPVTELKGKHTGFAHGGLMLHESHFPCATQSIWKAVSSLTLLSIK